MEAKCEPDSPIAARCVTASVRGVSCLRENGKVAASSGEVNATSAPEDTDNPAMARAAEASRAWAAIIARRSCKACATAAACVAKRDGWFNEACFGNWPGDCKFRREDAGECAMLRGECENDGLRDDARDLLAAEEGEVGAEERGERETDMRARGEQVPCSPVDVREKEGRPENVCGGSKLSRAQPWLERSP